MNQDSMDIIKANQNLEAQVKEWQVKCAFLEAQVNDLKHCLKAQEQIKEGMWEAQCRQSNEIKSWKNKAEQAEKRVKIEQDVAISLGEQLTSALNCEGRLRDELDNLKGQRSAFILEVKEANERWRNAEDANIKLCEKIAEYRKQLDAVATEEWDELKGQVAELQKQCTLLQDMLNASEQSIILANDQNALLKERIKELEKNPTAG